MSAAPAPAAEEGGAADGADAAPAHDSGGDGGGGGGGDGDGGSGGGGEGGGGADAWLEATDPSTGKPYYFVRSSSSRPRARGAGG